MATKLSVKKKFLLLILLFILSATCASANEDELIKGDEAIATVNGVPLSKALFDTEVETYKQSYKMQGTPLTKEDIKDLKKHIIESMIIDELCFQEGERQKISIEKAVVDKEITRLKKGFKDESEFKEVLNKLKIDETTLKERARKKFIADKYRKTSVEKIKREATVSDKECTTYYTAHPDQYKIPEQVRASHILIKTDGKADEKEREDSRKKLQNIKEKLVKNADFSALAKQYSECEDSKDKGGDMGYFEKKSVVPQIDEAAFSLKIGEISDIVESEFGMHLIKVTDKRAAKMVPYEKVKKGIEEFLKREKAQKNIAIFFKDLREKATVEM